MDKKLIISLLSVLVLSTTVVMADDTTTTNTTRQALPKFENGTPPDFVKGQPSQFSGQKGQFDGKRPSKKPDAKPGGDRKPPEWDNSSGNGQGFHGKQPPQLDKNGRPPKPPKEENTNTTTE